MEEKEKGRKGTEKKKGGGEIKNAKQEKRVEEKKNIYIYAYVDTYM